MIAKVICLLLYTLDTFRNTVKGGGKKIKGEKSTGKKRRESWAMRIIICLNVCEFDYRVFSS